MRAFFEWFNDGNSTPEMTWLILGKGPTFSKTLQFDLSRFRTISLNHAVREQPVTVAHVIDADVLQDCGDAIEQNAAALVMPWFPHVNNVAGKANLSEMLDRVPVLRRLNGQNRLLWYNL